MKKKPTLEEKLYALMSGEFALTRKNTTVTLLRHANALAANGGHDSDRRISEKGKKQCAAMKEVFGKPGFDVIFRSPLLRVADTLTELGADVNQAIVIPELVVTMGEPTHQSGVLDAAYEILGNVGLAEILKHKEVALAMDIFAANAIATLCEKMTKLPSVGTGETMKVLLAGHGWYNPIITYYLAGGDENARRHLLYHPMSECEMFNVGVSAAGDLLWSRVTCNI